MDINLSAIVLSYWIHELSAFNSKSSLISHKFLTPFWRGFSWKVEKIFFDKLTILLTVQEFCLIDVSFGLSSEAIMINLWGHSLTLPWSKLKIKYKLYRDIFLWLSYYLIINYTQSLIHYLIRWINNLWDFWLDGPHSSV